MKAKTYLLFVLLAILTTVAACAPVAAQSVERVERWGTYEVRLEGPQTGNPFVDVTFSADFRFAHRVVNAPGFYDGDGVYIVRFMPDEIGSWSYTTRSNRAELEGKSGAFTVSAPGPGNHGPVGVHDTYHFSYADGSPYYPIGTTCYGWSHQTDEVEQQTLATLKNSPFNKMRMLLLPHYARDMVRPREHPFARDAQGKEDYTRFNPEFFHHQEHRVRDLMELGIEADLILFHPYGDIPYTNLPAEVENRYLRYVTARFAAFRNVWWSIANEYDFLRHKTMLDWDRFFRVVQDSDPYSHLRSIHNSGPMYDHSKPWVTHVSVQSDEFAKTELWLKAYNKPVIFDECEYEGDSPARWGNLSGQEMVRRMWLATALGAYAGHSETYAKGGLLWLAHGAKLLGESTPRIAFLRRIIEETGPLTAQPENYYPLAGKKGEYYLYYFDYHQPKAYEVQLPPGGRYQAEWIDPWEMTVTPQPGTVEGKVRINLPAKPFQALRLRRVR
jgi:hypothetical protein